MHSLVDFPLGGARFTWSNHQSSPSLSRLDKFLIASDLVELFPQVCQIALPKSTSDHCPILLDANCEVEANGSWLAADGSRFGGVGFGSRC